MGRISNRAFVGLPACSYAYSVSKSSGSTLMIPASGRNEEYLQLVVHFTGDIVRDRTTGIVNFVPEFLMP